MWVSIFWPARRAVAQPIKEILDRSPVLYGEENSFSYKTTVVVIFDPECPVCKDACDELTRISRTYAQAEFYWVLVRPNERIMTAARPFFERMRGKWVEDAGIVAALGAKVTPEAFVLD
ncbi:MAG: hypothetical protein RMM53_08960, partial [Bacteroidia bacterium]|nr:hypothetical protein [Bacteroidia bacterium]